MWVEFSRDSKIGDRARGKKGVGTGVRRVFLRRKEPSSGAGGDP